MSELASHRIARIEQARLLNRYGRLIGKNARLRTHGTGPTSHVLVVSTDQGAMGWGLGRLPEGGTRLVGRRLDELFDPAQGVLVDAALPLDFALHDLAGAIVDRPVYKMLGGDGTVSVACYDGAIYMDDLDPEDAPRGIAVVLQHCAADYAAGHRAFKLKIGRGHRWMPAEEGLRRDVAVTRAVRERYPSCDMLVDANDGYTLDALLHYLDAVVDCRLFWIEEPFRENREDLRRLRGYLDAHSPQTLIADGEANPDVPFLLDLAAEKLLDVLLMDIHGFGLTPWRRLMRRLVELGVRASPHAWGEPLKTLYAAHLAAGLGNVVTVEGVPGTIDGVDSTGYRLQEGRLHLPERPGWGLDLLDGALA